MHEGTIAVICVTARCESLEAPERCLESQTRRADSCYLIAPETLNAAPWWSRVPFSEPPWYAPEMAINASFDRAFSDGADIVVYLGDMSWLDASALELVEKYFLEHREVPLLSGINCYHQSGASEHTRQAPDESLALKWCNFGLNEVDRVRENILAFERDGFIAGAVPAMCNLVSHTAIRREAWLGVNGLDERFTGASGYIDSNLACRMEAKFGPCHLHSGLVTHRVDYRMMRGQLGAASLEVPKPKHFPDERNYWLHQQLLEDEIKRGEHRAVRLYNPVRTLEPMAWCWGTYRKKW